MSPKLLLQELKYRRPNNPKGHVLNLSLGAMEFSACAYFLPMWGIGIELITNKCSAMGVTYSGH